MNQKQDQELTCKKINELSKDFMSRSVQLSYTEDSDSTRGATSTQSYKNSFLDQFPDIVKKHNNKSGFAQSEKKQKRRSSITAMPVPEDYQNEELEVVEEEEKQHHHLPHVKLLKDHKEFSHRIQQFCDKSENFNNERTKVRTYSVDKLEQVVEEDEKEEEKLLIKTPSNIEYLFDQNEFNNTPQTMRRVSNKKISNMIQSQELVIQEDFEDDKNQNQKEYKKRSIFSNETSPRYKMVDELEQNKNTFNFQETEIETIQEEKEDQNEKSNIQKQFSSTMGKLHKEQEFIINIQVDEQRENINDNQIDSMQKIQEIDDALEDDNTNNNKQNNSKRSSLKFIQ